MKTKRKSGTRTKINQKNNHPAVIVIFGATGDLSRKKLLPALLHLYAERFLPEFFRVIGVSRKDFSDNDFRLFAKEAAEKNGHKYSAEVIENFLKNIHYQKGAADDLQTYKNLSLVLGKFDREVGAISDKLFYLSVPPSSYGDILKNLSASKLAGKNKKETRILVEKPFGSDYETAKELDRRLKSVFNENQIFRIDHYLAKDAVLNILAFRFSNTLFEKLWNRKGVEKVHIKLYENFGIDGRGDFYDSVGALRDVGQNHLLQMMALIAMDEPAALKPEILRQNRTRALESLKVYSAAEVKKNTARFQCESYKKTDGVAEKSKTETYFMIKAFINNKRWRGIPFYLESGKNLEDSKVEIDIFFKPAKFGGNTLKDDNKKGNVLTLAIQPKQKVSANFLVKRPGVIFGLEPQTLSFEYDKNANGISRLPDAYEKVIFDCINGDQTLFAGSGEVEAAWKFITPISKVWQKSGKPGVYKPGQMPEVKL